MTKGEKKRKSIADHLTYLHIRKIKKWMFCPSCQKGKMTINKKSTLWTCEDCGYKLPADEFEDGYVFWFCDECNSYLNSQEGFDRNASRHICQNCGYENDTTFDNLRGVCSDCGKIIPDSDNTLCADCRQERLRKAKERIVRIGKVAGAVVAVAGEVYLAAQSADAGSVSYASLLNEEDDRDESGAHMRFDYVTNYWLETASEDDLRATARQMESLMDELDYYSEEYTRISGIHTDVVNAIASRFPLNLPHREHGWYLPNDE